MPEACIFCPNRPKRKAGPVLALTLQCPPAELPDLDRIASWDSGGEGAVMNGRRAGSETAAEGSPRIGLQRNGNPVGLLPGNGRPHHGLPPGNRPDSEGPVRGFISPGLSGSLSKGKVEALPTGRNFFAIDVASLPTPAAWRIGREMADKLLCKHLEEEGRFRKASGSASGARTRSSPTESCSADSLPYGSQTGLGRQGRVREVETIPWKNCQ
jgi:cobaltochelatase CobN